LFCVTVRFDSTGYVVRLWEDGKICPEDLGTDIKIEESKAGPNQLAFSFIFSKTLLYTLKKEGSEKLTISAEVEVHYSDQSRKRMAFALQQDSKDKDTFSVNPEVRGDSDSHYDSSITLFFSLLILFILSLM